MLKTLYKFDFRRGYIIYPTLVVVVGVFDEKHRANFMACVWNTALSFEPPLYGVSISPKRATHDLILNKKAFSICFYPFEKSEDVEFFGTHSYRDTDKSRNVNLIKGSKLDVPIPLDAYAVLECSLFDYKTYGDHTLFVGEIVVIHYDENSIYNLFDMPVLDLSKKKPVLYLGNGVYITVDEKTILNLRK